MQKTALLLSVFFAFILLSCAPERTKNHKAEDAKDAFVLTKKKVSKTLDLPAELLPFERAEINAKVEGYIQKYLVDIGDKVRKGQILAVLDAPEIVARSAEAEAEYDEAKAHYEASLDKFNRLSKASREQGVIAESDLITAGNLVSADSSAVVSARSKTLSYRHLQAYLTIQAPFNGIITKRFIDVGDLVGSKDHSILFVLERPDILRLRIHVPEAYVKSHPEEKVLAFTTDAVANKTFYANPARKSESIDPDTRTELWEYEYDNGDYALKPGMYAMAHIILMREGSSFVVPFSSVVTSLERQFIVRANLGKVEWVDVKEGISMKDSVEIFGDMQEGDTLLTRGSEELKPGIAVKIMIQSQ